MKNIGLTGGIGSGKSTISKIFISKGIPVYDSDSKAKFLMNSSIELKNNIIKKFGNESYKNNKLNRKYLANIVFNDKLKMIKINSLVHPYVYKDYNDWKRGIFSKYVIFESALIFETGSYKNNDFNILVVSDIDKRIKRIKNRDKLSKKDIIKRIHNQWSDDKKISLCDYIIKNNSLTKTKEKVIKMIEYLDEKFK